MRILIEEEILFSNLPKDFDERISLKNEFGEALFSYQNYGLRNALQKFGYDKWEDVEDYWEKKNIVEIAKETKSQLYLVSWYAEEVGNGFGRQVMRKLFELGEKYKLDRFTIFLPSLHAQNILKHYVESGNIEAVKESKTGLSVMEYHTTYKFVKKI